MQNKSNILNNFTGTLSFSLETSLSPLFIELFMKLEMFSQSKSVFIIQKFYILAKASKMYLNG